MRLYFNRGSCNDHCMYILAGRRFSKTWLPVQKRYISVRYVPSSEPAYVDTSSIRNNGEENTQHWSVRRQRHPWGQYPYLEVKGSSKRYFPESPYEKAGNDPETSVDKLLGYNRRTKGYQIRSSPWNGGDVESFLPLSGRWLRDHCSCPECVNKDTGQRKTNVLNGEVECNVIAVEKQGDQTTLRVTFADGHISNISAAAISNRHSMKRTADQFGQVSLKRWDAAEATEKTPSVSFNEMKGTDVGLAKALMLLKIYGFCFIDSMPPTPEASEELLKRIGPIRNTHYGGFYDFTSDLSSKDTAYTAEALEPHTDTTYFTDPVGLQALHLISHTDGEGGLSSLVDGFHCAERLFKEDVAAYKILSETGVSGHASGNEGISIQPSDSFPTLVHSKRGYLMQVRWNNADRAGIDRPLTKIDSWYDAAGKWHKLITSPSNQYWFQLEPGKMLLFDNWRVLHGRSAFTGKRRMCGGYINHDDWISKMKSLNLTTKELKASTVRG